MQANIVRRCDVLAALDARNLARKLRRMGRDGLAEVARDMVRRHLRRAAASKAGS